MSTIPISRQTVEPVIPTLGTMHGNIPLTDVVNPLAIVNDNIDLNPISPMEETMFNPTMNQSFMIAVEEKTRNMNSEAIQAGLPTGNVTLSPNWRVPIEEVIPENQNPVQQYLGLPSWLPSQQYKNRSTYRTSNLKPDIIKNSILRSKRLY